MSDPLFADAPAARRDRPDGPITRWTYTLLDAFETCPKRAWYSGVQKIRGLVNEAMSRGSRIHSGLEAYLKGDDDPGVLAELPNKDYWTPLLEGLRGRAVVEARWGIDAAWQPTGWGDDDCWMRCVPDVAHLDMGLPRDPPLLIIDFKTGKRYGKEIAHMRQALCYACAAIPRYPAVETFQMEVWYLDEPLPENRVLSRELPKEAIEAFRRRIDMSATAMLSETEFLATPAPRICKFCPHRDICPDRM